MTNHLRNLLQAAAVVAGILVPALSAAQSTWNLGSSACGSGGGTTYASITCNAGSPSVSATMYAFGTTGGAGTAFATGTLANWDPNGFGAYVGSDSGSPYHAFDSSNPAGSTELMLISFGTNKVSLSDVAIGWWSTDADVSILRWDGATAVDPKSLVNNKTTTGLISAGWTLVGSQDLDGTGTPIDNVNDGPGTGLTDTGNSARRSTVNLGSQVSSYWIISTYFGSTTGTNPSKLDGGNDAFKILSFAANVCTSGTYTGGDAASHNGGTCGSSQTGSGVPEPPMMAMLGLALVGAGVSHGRARRRLKPSFA